MSQLLLVGNPAKRRKPRSAAQKAATRKMLAANRRKRPVKRHAVARPNPAPSRRRRRVAKVSRSIRRVRSNPIKGLEMRQITRHLKNAGIGAAGAIGVDALYGFLLSYLPASMQVETSSDGSMNPAYYAGKAATAIGAGLLLKNVLKDDAKVSAVIEGSLAVTIYKAMARFMTNNVTSVQLGAYIPGGLQVGTLPGSQNLRGLGNMRQYLNRVGHTRDSESPVMSERESNFNR